MMGCGVGMVLAYMVWQWLSYDDVLRMEVVVPVGVV